MKNYRKATGIIAVAAALLIFFGCTKEKYHFDSIGVGDLNWDPSLAAPLINSRLSLEDFLADSSGLLLHDTADQSLKIVYSGKVFSQMAQDIFSVPDQTTNFDLILPIPPILTPGDSLSLPLTIQESFAMPTGDILDTLSFKAGTYEISLVGDLNHDAKIKVTSNDILLNGLPFETILDYQYNGTLPVTVTNTLSLNDFTFKFDNTGLDTNIINLNLEVTAYITNNPIDTPHYTLSLINDFRDLEFVSLFGELNTQAISLDQDSIELNLFNSNIQGSFNLNDPKVKLTFGNSFGLPISIDMTNFTSYSAYNPPYNVNLSGPGIPNPFILNSPNPQLIGQTVNTILDLDKNNSNIDDFINISPDLVIYKIDAELNPYGAGTKTFILDTSKLDVSVDVEVPLAGSISNFVLQDTFAFSFDDIQDVDFIDNVEFKISVDNGFPMDIAIQAYFVDSLGNVLDSLMNGLENLVLAAPAGPAPDYKSTTTTNKRTNILFPKSKIDALGNTSDMIIKAKLVTVDGGASTIKVYSDYYVDFKLGVKTDLNANL